MGGSPSPRVRSDQKQQRLYRTKHENRENRMDEKKSKTVCERRGLTLTSVNGKNRSSVKQCQTISDQQATPGLSGSCEFLLASFNYGAWTRRRLLLLLLRQSKCYKIVNSGDANTCRTRCDAGTRKQKCHGFLDSTRTRCCFATRKPPVRQTV